MAEKLNKDAVYKAAKPEEKDYFINDRGGLYMWVKSGGSKLWQFVYTYEGKRKRLALGAYPAVTLEFARRKASEIREHLANDNDPAEGRKKVRQDKQRAKLNQERKSDGLPILNSFADTTGKWLDSIINTNTSDTLTKKKNRLTTWIFPFICLRAERSAWPSCWVDWMLIMRFFPFGKLLGENNQYSSLISRTGKLI